MTESEHATHAHNILRALAPETRALRHMIPDVYAGYAALAGAVFDDGALPRKVKELIALAIAVVDMCDGCIASHASTAAKAGATREEVAEMIGVTFAMRGGPATVHGARAYAAFLEYADPVAEATQ